MSAPLDPGAVAQGVAELDVEVDKYVLAMQHGIGERGEAQAFCDFTALFLHDFEHPLVAALLVSALRRLAVQDGPR